MLTKTVNQKICLETGVTEGRAIARLYQIERAAPEAIGNVCDNLCVHTQVAQSQKELDAKCASCQLDKLLRLIRSK